MSLESRLLELVGSIGADIKALFSRALPSGGTSGQVLAKTSATNYAVGWTTPATGDMVRSTYDTNADGKVNSADSADAVPWTGVTGKPSTFAPSAHTHPISDVTSLQTSLDGKQATLVSGTNIKTVAGTSLLGSGDIPVPVTKSGTTVQVGATTDVVVIGATADDGSGAKLQVAGQIEMKHASARADAVMQSNAAGVMTWGRKFTHGTSAPASPAVGDIWFDTN